MPSTGRHRGPPPSPPRRPAVAPVLGVLLLGCSLAVLVGAASAGRLPTPGGPATPSVLASTPDGTAPSPSASSRATVTTTGPSQTGPSEPAEGRPASSTPAAGAWVAVVAGLDERRAAAFAEGSVAELETVYATGSPARARDLAALRSLVGAGGSAHGVRPALRSVRAVSPSGAVPSGPADRVVLVVVDVLAPSIVVDASGRSAVRPGRGERRWQLTLVRVAGRWLVRDVAAA